MILRVGLVVLLIVSLLFVGLFLYNTRESRVINQVFNGGGVCETLPKNVCDAIPRYCEWDENESSMIMCKTKNN